MAISVWAPSCFVSPLIVHFTQNKKTSHIAPSTNNEWFTIHLDAWYWCIDLYECRLNIVLFILVNVWPMTHLIYWFPSQLWFCLIDSTFLVFPQFRFQSASVFPRSFTFSKGRMKRMYRHISLSTEFYFEKNENVRGLIRSRITISIESGNNFVTFLKSWMVDFHLDMSSLQNSKMTWNNNCC